MHNFRFPTSATDHEGVSTDGHTLGIILTGAASEYIQLNQGDHGASLTLNLGTDAAEAKRRLDEVCGLITTNDTAISLIEIDGPSALPWRQYTQVFTDLLNRVSRLAVPEEKVVTLRERMGAQIVESLHGVLPLVPGGVSLHNVISAVPLTSRVVALSPGNAEQLDEQAKLAMRLLTSFQECRFVPRAMRGIIVNLARVVKKNMHADRVRYRRLCAARSTLEPWGRATEESDTDRCRSNSHDCTTLKRITLKPKSKNLDSSRQMDKMEDKMERKMECKVEYKMEHNLEHKMECKMEHKMECKMEDKMESKMEHNMEHTTKHTTEHTMEHNMEDNGNQMQPASDHSCTDDAHLPSNCNILHQDGATDTTNHCHDKEPAGGCTKYDIITKVTAMQKCYVCSVQTPVAKAKTGPQAQYPRMCPACAACNLRMRNTSADLAGYYAIVTGGRLKIGYETVLKLLRAGCHVIATTRFPHDAAKRYSLELDYADWSHRLQIYQLELQYVKGIYKFVEEMKMTLPHLDILINNAAQTLRRPSSFYEHLARFELLPPEALPERLTQLLPASKRHRPGHTAVTNCLATTGAHTGMHPGIHNSIYDTAACDISHGCMHHILHDSARDSVCDSTHDRMAEVWTTRVKHEIRITPGKRCHSPNIEICISKKPRLDDNDNTNAHVNAVIDANIDVDVADYANASNNATDDADDNDDDANNADANDNADADANDMADTNDMAVTNDMADANDTTDANTKGGAHVTTDVDDNADLNIYSNADSECHADADDVVAGTAVNVDVNVDAAVNVDANVYGVVESNDDANIDANGDADINVDANTYSGAQSNHSVNVDANANADVNNDANADVNADADIDINDVKADSNTDVNVNTDENANAEADINADTDSNAEVGLADKLLTGDFPRGCLDEFGQQLDLRHTNSWRSCLEEVPLIELLEVLTINTVAPYILNKELKTLLQMSPHRHRFIVNTSSMEGQFRRVAKTRFHPHTNMAKAALNMMTRTGALGYVDSCIYMTAVDTGWVSDERPFLQAAHEAAKGFILPLDCVDGAARVLHPVFEGVSESCAKPHYAVFLKNYAPYPW